MRSIEKFDFDLWWSWQGAEGVIPAWSRPMAGFFSVQILRVQCTELWNLAYSSGENSVSASFEQEVQCFPSKLSLLSSVAVTSSGVEM